jgi:hypothetical protein
MKTDIEINSFSGHKTSGGHRRNWGGGGEEGGQNNPRVRLFFSSIQKADWIGHILRRNCLLQQVTEG